MRTTIGTAALAATVALAISAPRAAAQGRGGGQSNTTNKTPTVDPKDLAEARSFDAENPIGFMIEHVSELRLVDTQITRLAELKANLTRDNGALKERLDSIRPPGSPSRIDFSVLTPPQRDSVLQQRKAVAETMGQMHDNSRRARTEALALLSPEQQQRYTDLENRMRSVIRDATFSGQTSADGGPPLGAAKKPR